MAMPALPAAALLVAPGRAMEEPLPQVRLARSVCSPAESAQLPQVSQLAVAGSDGPVRALASWQ